jgi:hypothetical protein
MSTHKPHLYVEPLSSEVISVIQGLQAWLTEAKFNVFSIALGNVSRQHAYCISDDRYEKADLVTENLGVDIQVFGFDPGQRSKETTN